MSPIRFRVLPRAISDSIGQHQKNSLEKWLTIGVLVVPGMAIFLLFLLLPIVQSTYFSLYKWNGFGPPVDFRWFDNYIDLMKDKVFISSVGHSFTFMTLALFIQLPLSLGLALLVGRGTMPGRQIFRAILFIPYIFSEVITAIIWLYVLHPRAGLMNKVFGTLIPDFNPIPWLANRDVALFSIFLVITWKFFGFHMLLYMAGLQSIPKDLEEASRIDGCTEWQVLRFITLPLLGSTIRLTVYLSVLGSFQQFVIVWVMTQGGPVDSTATIATYLFKYGIQRFALGYGSAVAVVLFIVTLFFSVGYQRIVMRQDYELKV
jgi:raffinose/stachyose/melibiose transport system permease protein